MTSRLVFEQKNSNQTIRMPWEWQGDHWMPVTEFENGFPATRSYVFWGSYVRGGGEVVLVAEHRQRLFYQQYSFFRAIPTMNAEWLQRRPPRRETIHMTSHFPEDQHVPLDHPTAMAGVGAPRMPFPGEMPAVEQYPQFLPHGVIGRPHITQRAIDLGMQTFHAERRITEPVVVYVAHYPEPPRPGEEPTIRHIYPIHVPTLVSPRFGPPVSHFNERRPPPHINRAQFPPPTARSLPNSPSFLPSTMMLHPPVAMNYGQEHTIRSSANRLAAINNAGAANRHIHELQIASSPPSNSTGASDSQETSSTPQHSPSLELGAEQEDTLPPSDNQEEPAGQHADPPSIPSNGSSHTSGINGNQLSYAAAARKYLPKNTVQPKQVNSSLSPKKTFSGTSDGTAQIPPKTTENSKTKLKEESDEVIPKSDSGTDKKVPNSGTETKEQNARSNTSTPRKTKKSEEEVKPPANPNGAETRNSTPGKQASTNILNTKPKSPTTSQKEKTSVKSNGSGSGKSSTGTSGATYGATTSKKPDSKSTASEESKKSARSNDSSSGKSSTGNSGAAKTSKKSKDESTPPAHTNGAAPGNSATLSVPAKGTTAPLKPNTKSNASQKAKKSQHSNDSSPGKSATGNAGAKKSEKQETSSPANTDYLPGNGSDGSAISAPPKQEAPAPTIPSNSTGTEKSSAKKTPKSKTPAVQVVHKSQNRSNESSSGESSGRSSTKSNDGSDAKPPTGPTSTGAGKSTKKKQTPPKPSGSSSLNRLKKAPLPDISGESSSGASSSKQPRKVPTSFAKPISSSSAEHETSFIENNVSNSSRSAHKSGGKNSTGAPKGAEDLNEQDKANVLNAIAYLTSKEQIAGNPKENEALAEQQAADVLHSFKSPGAQSSTSAAKLKEKKELEEAIDVLMERLNSIQSVASEEEDPKAQESHDEKEELGRSIEDLILRNKKLDIIMDILKNDVLFQKLVPRMHESLVSYSNKQEVKRAEFLDTLEMPESSTEVDQEILHFLWENKDNLPLLITRSEEAKRFATARMQYHLENNNSRSFMLWDYIQDVELSEVFVQDMAYLANEMEKENADFALVDTRYVENVFKAVTEADDFRNRVTANVEKYLKRQRTIRALPESIPLSQLRLTEIEEIFLSRWREESSEYLAYPVEQRLKNPKRYFDELTDAMAATKDLSTETQHAAKGEVMQSWMAGVKIWSEFQNDEIAFDAFVLYSADAPTLSGYFTQITGISFLGM